MKLKEILKPALILCVICLLATAALAGTNMLTADTIAQQKVITEQESRKQVLPDADSFEEADGYAIGKAGSDVAGYVFVTSAKGYGGDVQVMTGINAEGQVTGVVILEQNETPGLGANAEKESFRDQFKQATPENGFTVTKSTAKDGEISAMTGATITTTAVTNAVNEAVAQYHEIKEGA